MLKNEFGIWRQKNIIHQWFFGSFFCNFFFLYLLKEMIRHINKHKEELEKLTVKLENKQAVEIKETGSHWKCWVKFAQLLSHVHSLWLDELQNASHLVPQYGCYWKGLNVVWGRWAPKSGERNKKAIESCKEGSAPNTHLCKTQCLMLWSSQDSGVWKNSFLSWERKQHPQKIMQVQEVE